MTLQEKLDAFKAQFESSGPPEALALMHRATDELRDSGIMASVLKAGDRAPDFALPNSEGEMVETLALRAKGPLVVTFYRGIW